jgi:hypothetical protein
LRPILIVSLLCVIFCAAPARAQRVLGPAEFRDQIGAALHTLGPDLCVRAVDNYTLHFGPSQSECDSFLYIDNGYNEYLSNPGTLAVIVQRYLPIASQLLSGDIAREGGERNRIVVVLRNSDYARLCGVPADTFVSRPFAGDLIAILMLDSPTHLMNRSPENLAELALSVDEAFTLAAGNLRTRLGPVELAQEQGVDVVGAQSALISGTLWLSESCGPQSEGKLALLAARDYYFSSNGNDTAHRNFFLGFSRRLIATGESLSSTVLICRAGHWEAWASES